WDLPECETSARSDCYDGRSSAGSVLRAALRVRRARRSSRSRRSLHAHSVHFVENGTRRGHRIVRLRNRTSHDEVVGAGRDRLSRGHHALLIAVRRSAWANAGRERKEIVAEETLEVAHFARAAYDAGAAGIARERRQTRRVLTGSPMQAELEQV